METLKGLRRADRLKKSGGVFMLVSWQSLLLPFYGVLLLGSRKAIRYLSHGVSNLIATPAPRLETEDGNISNDLGGQHYGKKTTCPNTRIYPHTSPHLFNAEGNTGAGASFCFLGGPGMNNPYLILLALCQSTSLSPKNIDRLNVLPAQISPALDSLAGAAVTLENLADDMDRDEIDYLGDTDTLRRQAEELQQLRHQLTALAQKISDSSNTAEVSYGIR